MNYKGIPYIKSDCPVQKFLTVDKGCFNNVHDT